jgi:Arc/MetJ-type ribon-helix-helix transcriptional regulator
MNISLSEELYSFVLQRVDAGCYGSASEYIRTLLRRDREGRVDRPAAFPAPRPANDYLENSGSAACPVVPAAEGRNCPRRPDLLS